MFTRGSGRSGRRTFLKAAGVTVLGGAVAGCTGDGGDGSDGGDGGGGDGGDGGGGGGDGGDGGGGELPTLRYAGIPNTQLNDLNTMFLQSDHMRENVLPNVGERYDTDLVMVQGTPQVVNAIGAGEADAGLLAYSSLANALANDAIESGASILAPLTYDGPRHADTYASQAGSDITDIEDVEGTTFAVNAIGTAVDIAARIGLQDNGVDPEQVQFRELSFGAIPDTLAEGQVDVGTFIQPFFQMNEDDLQPIFDTATAFGPHLKIFIAGRNDLLESDPDLVRWWMEDYWAGMQWWRDDANSEQRLDIAEEILGLPRGLLEQLVQTDQGYYHGEEGFGIDPKWVQEPVDGMHRVGFLPEELDMAQYIDTSFLPEDANTEPPLE